MFTTVGKYRVRQSSVEELAQRVRGGFVPPVRFTRRRPRRAHHHQRVRQRGSGTRLQREAADWVRNNVLEFTKGMPEVMVGNVLIAEVK